MDIHPVKEGRIANIKKIKGSVWQIQAYQAVYLIKNSYTLYQSTFVGWNSTLFLSKKTADFHKILFSKAISSVILTSLFTSLGLAKKDIKTVYSLTDSETSLITYRHKTGHWWLRRQQKFKTPANTDGQLNRQRNAEIYISIQMVPEIALNHTDS